MRNKGFVIFLTLLITLLCVYYLSFTFIAQNIQNDVNDRLRDAQGDVNLLQKQRYLDSIWNEPIYNYLGLGDYTYKEIKETELNLGLDLQGGMHVTLEVSPIDIIVGLSGESTDSTFLYALEKASAEAQTQQINFVETFYRHFKSTHPNKPLSDIFATVANRDRFTLSSTDDEILKVIQDEVDDAINRSFNILRSRIDRFGTSQPNIQRLQGTGRIQIELPGIDNPERVRKLLQGVAKLEFWEVQNPEEFVPLLEKIDRVIADEMKKEGLSDSLEIADSDDDVLSLIAEEETEADTVNTEDTVATADNLENTDSLLATQRSPIFTLLRSQYSLVYELGDTMQINKILEREDIKRMIPRTTKFLWAVKPDKNNTGTVQYLELFAINVPRNGKAPLEGDVVTDARFDFDERAQPGVSMQMNPTGAKLWKKLTAKNVGRKIAIVLDNYVYSAPNVNEEIPSGRSSISGNFTREEALDLANILKAGALPAPTTIVEDVVIGPSLGKVAQKQGILSIIVGILIVILFMIVYYAKGGIIANLALFINIFFILGILASTQGVALTLPGIAGIVLTIGMSIDANVLIFERIKEELRNGAKLKQAISSGYQKAYWSIFDANATTLIVGIILFTMGQGPVKGFAITLIIGILCSFFSAVFITRVIIEYLSRNDEKSKMSFSNPFTSKALTGLQIDFLSKRKIAYIFSVSFILLGMISLLIKGVNLGVDFKGGRSYIVAFSTPQVPSQLKQKLEPYFENYGTEVKTYGDDNTLKITTSFKIDESSDETDELVKSNLTAGLQSLSLNPSSSDSSQLAKDPFQITGQSKVSPTIADDIKFSSYKSSFFALILIFLYILIRFKKWQFGLGALLALFHDSLFVLSAFAIANVLGISFEIDQVFVAALLTIIGYSINDTVVVFDRIRENLNIKKGSEMIRVFNESLNHTISRTLITSVTTLIVVLVLFIFGGPALQGFSFALTIGILIGTYSSIFIATPIALDLSKK